MLAKKRLDLAVTERPIIFTEDNPRKILEGRKTETRRIMKPQPVYDPEFLGGWVLKTTRADTSIQSFNEGMYPETCPFGRVGERLWVRESFAIGQKLNGWTPEETPTVYYRADPENEDLMWEHENGVTDFKVPWKPSIYMPRTACRMVLELTSVRVERLQDITEAGAKAEGVEVAPGNYPESGQSNSYRGAFAFMWNEINLKRGSWSDNPWVWKIAFRRVRGNAKV